MCEMFSLDSGLPSVEKWKGPVEGVINHQSILACGCLSVIIQDLLEHPPIGTSGDLVHLLGSVRRRLPLLVISNPNDF